MPLLVIKDRRTLMRAQLDTSAAIIRAQACWQRSPEVSVGCTCGPQTETEPSLLALSRRLAHAVLDIDTVLKTSLEGDYAPNGSAEVAV